VLAWCAAESEERVGGRTREEGMSSPLSLQKHDDCLKLAKKAVGSA
jgi:hypothetical protein